MSSKTFLTISKQECQSVYLDILNNSNQKWESGKKLAEVEEYGSAISLAFISVEELVKAMIIFLDGKGFDFRNVKGMNSFFRNHQIRYVIAYAMFAMSIFGNEILKFIKKIRKKPQKFIALADEIQTDKNYFEKNLKHYALSKFLLLQRELKWFAKADIFRQDGFYCDYQEELRNPILITSKEYKQVIRKLEKVRTFGLGIIDAFNTEEEFYSTFLAEQIVEFKEKGYYDKMAQALAKVKQSKGNPFELIAAAIKGKEQ